MRGMINAVGLTVESFIDNESSSIFLIGQLLMHSGWCGSARRVCFNTGVVDFNRADDAITIRVDFPEPAEATFSYEVFQRIILDRICDYRHGLETSGSHT